MKVRELSHIKVLGAWYRVVGTTYSKTRNETDYLIINHNKDYVDVRDVDVQGKKYEMVTPEPGSLMDLMSEVTFDVKFIRDWRQRRKKKDHGDT